MLVLGEGRAGFFVGILGKEGQRGWVGLNTSAKFLNPSHELPGLILGANTNSSIAVGQHLGLGQKYPLDLGFATATSC